MKECPFVLGEIAIFESHLRRETYVSRIMKVHIDYYGSPMIPKIRKANNEEKKAWYDNAEYELILEENVTAST